MSKVAITDTYLTNIANAIRGKSGSSDTYTPSEMASAITNIPSGGTDGVYLVSTDAEMALIQNPQINDYCILNNTITGRTNLYKYDGTSWIGQIQGNIPSGYTVLKYLEGTGTQYINTGYKPYKTRTDLIFQQTGGTTASYYIVGLKDSDIGRYIVAIYNSAQRAWLTTDKEASEWVLLSNHNNNPHLLVYNDTNHKVVFDGVDKMVVSDFTSEASRPVYLFGLNNLGNPDGLFKGRIYYCKFTDKETGLVVREFIPCKRNSDNVVGMYETVSGVFYTNDGTGTFSYA